MSNGIPLNPLKGCSHIISCCITKFPCHFFISSQFGDPVTHIAWLLGALAPRGIQLRSLSGYSAGRSPPGTLARMAKRLNPAGTVRVHRALAPQGGSLGLLRLLPPQPEAAKENVPRDGGGCQCL